MFSRGMLCAALGAGVVFGASPAMAMDKAQLVDIVLKRSGGSAADVGRTLDGFIAATTSAMKKGDRISLVGFGSFSVARTTASANACDSEVQIDFSPSVSFHARKKEEGGRHTPFHNKIARILPQADGSLVLLGATNGESVSKGTDVFVYNAPDGSAVPAFGQIAGVVVRARGNGETSYEVLENGAGKSVLGVVVTGVSATAVELGGYVETLPPVKEDAPIGACPDGGYDGGLTTDDTLLKEITASTRLPYDVVFVIYNVLLDVVVEAVNAGELVDLGTTFGAFVQETQITASVADDPCAGLPENCPPTGVADTVYPYIDFDVSVETGAATGKELKQLESAVLALAQKAARTGRNPQTGKEIKIAAKNKVRFKAGAELSDKVN